VIETYSKSIVIDELSDKTCLSFVLIVLCGLVKFITVKYSVCDDYSRRFLVNSSPANCCVSQKRNNVNLGIICLEFRPIITVSV